MNHALKEWNVAVNALAQGETILLMRKGGIRETQGRFDVPHRRVWLYPTYEHQKPNLLKPDYARQVQPVEPGWHPDSVELRAWADITHLFEVTDAETVDALYPFHIWSQDFAYERFRWKVRSPLYILLLRVYRLTEPITLPFDDAYKGCKSWIDLALGQENSTRASSATPALADDEYHRQVEAIQSIIPSKTPLTQA
ncbi:MAG: DUF1802 family protein [Leptolyngbyaceae bacterium]|nr:DUF1802 family protein [Leptolyngbyaceae bacterium]